MTAKTLATAVAIAFHLASGPAAGADFTHRDAGPTESQMLANSDGGLPGLAFVRPCSTGCSTAPGSRAATRPHRTLRHPARGALRSGFSGARYVDFGTKTQFGKTSCGGRTFDYEKGTSSNAEDIMREVHSVIENPTKGPCSSTACGAWHSSGAVSAMALMQFCDWPRSKATAYCTRRGTTRPAAAAAATSGSTASSRDFESTRR